MAVRLLALLALACASDTVYHVAGFISTADFGRKDRYSSTRTPKESSAAPSFPSSFARRRNRSQDDDDAINLAKTTSIPQLPPSGDSSFGMLPIVESSVTVSTDSAFVNTKIGLQYTCCICEYRNTHMVSRIAYTKGVVVAVCKGCQAKHLVADNLGAAGNYRLEESQTVHRVTKDQYQISRLYSYDTRSGAIVGQDGKMALE